MSREVAIRTDRPLRIEQRALPEDPELAPGSAVIGTFIAGRLIARVAVPPESFSPNELGSSDAHLAYCATELDDGSIKSQICAVVPVEKEPWQDGPAEEEMILLGNVLRLEKDRKYPSDLNLEAVDHFTAILQGNAVPVVDKLLEGI